jgi:hypothetical protein
MMLLGSGLLSLGGLLRKRWIGQFERLPRSSVTLVLFHNPDCGQGFLLRR